MLDYIKQVTRYEKIAYVGHSMGTTIMMRLAAVRPDYVEESVSTFVAIAPVLLLKQIKSEFVSIMISLQD